jgi:hypothetical protein
MLVASGAGLSAPLLGAMKRMRDGQTQRI